MARVFFVVFLFAPLACLAHVTGGPHSMASGFTHPLTGLDHLLALLAVGWTAHRPARLRDGQASLPLLFLGGMLAGAGLGLAGLSSPATEYGICLSLILLGISIAFSVRVRNWGILFAATGLCHGLAHGAACPAAAGSVAFLAGMVASSALLLTAGRLAHRRIERSRAHFAVRLAVSACLVVIGTCLMDRL